MSIVEQEREAILKVGYIVAINSDKIIYDKGLQELIDQLMSSPDKMYTYVVYVDGKPVTNWRLLGRMEGRAEAHAAWMQAAKLKLLFGLIEHRFGTPSTEVQTQIQGLSANQLDELGIVLTNCNTWTDVEDWLAARS